MVDDIHTMIYWLVGILIGIIILDYFWYRPFQQRQKTEHIIECLRKKAKGFHQTLPKFHGRGIVIPISNNCIVSGALLIISLRKIGCRLPVLVTYNDLQKKYRRFLERVHDVKTLNLAKKLGAVHDSQMGPYSLIYSPFEQVILIDPKVLLLYNPEYLFQDTLFQQTGAMFWKDRRYNGHRDSKTFSWIRKLIPYRKGDNRILDKKAGNYQDAGLVLIDKKRHLKTLEKLWVLTNNWEIVYDYIPGNKETYWMAAELARQEYAFVPTFAGVIGEIAELSGALCGHPLHLDVSGRMLWINGSLFKSEHSHHLLDFSHYALDDDHDAVWKPWGVCLQGATVNELPPEHKQLLNDYTKLLQQIKDQLLIKDEESDSD